MTSDGGTNTRMSLMAVVGQVSCMLVRALCLSDILMDTVNMFEHIQQSNKICNQRYSAVIFVVPALKWLIVMLL